MIAMNQPFSKCLAGLAVLLLTVLIAHDGRAQCGSSGDPIVNITFGEDEPVFGDGVSTYLRVNRSPEDGEYTLSKNANFGNGWHNMPDRSGSGFMLVVNADDNQTGEFYRTKVEGLCQNTNFYFSAFIANVNTPAQIENPCNGNLRLPNVKFLILDGEGNEIASLDTTDVPVSELPQWREYGLFFNTGSQTEFQLVLINNNLGGCGNDLAIDDIQFTPCGPPITLAMDETLKQVDTLFFCEGAVTPIQLSGRIADDDSYSAEPVFQWQSRPDNEPEWTDMPGERDRELRFVPTHNHWYRLTAAASAANLAEPLCRISSDPIRIARLVPQPHATDVNRRGPLCENESIVLNPPLYAGTGAGPVTYLWQLDDGNGPITIPGATSPAYEFQATTSGMIRLLRQAINGCGDSFVADIFEIEVPETIHTRLTLVPSERCADDGPVSLAGGQIVNGDDGMVGVYRGTGVIDGVFYPAIAGVGQHTITFSPPSGTRCPSPSQATITVHDTIYLEPMLNAIMLRGQQITLRPQTDASQFNWSNEPGLDNYRTPNPVASPNETTTYTLTASNALGCEKTETVTVTVLQDLIVPNSFTPNGDNVNDTWEIKGLSNYPDAFLQVFNRWGTRVFSSKGYTEPWNGQHKGTTLPTGTYYYTLSSSILVQPLSGSVSILR